MFVFAAILLSYYWQNSRGESLQRKDLLFLDVSLTTSSGIGTRESLTPTIEPHSRCRGLLVQKWSLEQIFSKNQNSIILVMNLRYGGRLRKAVSTFSCLIVKKWWIRIQNAAATDPLFPEVAVDQVSWGESDLREENLSFSSGFMTVIASVMSSRLFQEVSTVKSNCRSRTAKCFASKTVWRFQHFECLLSETIDSVRRWKSDLVLNDCRALATGSIKHLLMLRKNDYIRTLGEIGPWQRENLCLMFWADYLSGKTPRGIRMEKGCDPQIGFITS